METDDIFRSGELNPDISSNYIWKLFRQLALPLVGVTPPPPHSKLKLYLGQSTDIVIKKRGCGPVAWNDIRRSLFHKENKQT
jgi:hypothetical protein